MKSRKYYENLFSSYPDLVTPRHVRIMLGGVGRNTVYYLLQNGLIFHYNVNGSFLIPKSAVTDYILSVHYASFKEKLRHQV